MTKLGYQLEHDVEQYFLELVNQTRDIPVSQRSHRITSSGAMRGDKGDVISKIDWLPIQLHCECKDWKVIQKKRGQIFNVDINWLIELEAQAVITNSLPIFIFTFKGARTNRRQVVFTYDAFLKFLSFINSGIRSNTSTINITENKGFKGVKKGSDYFLIVKSDVDSFYEKDKNYVFLLDDTIRKKHYNMITWDYFDYIMKGIKEQRGASNV